MVVTPASNHGGAHYALSSIERLSRRRRSIAAARSRAHALQLKTMLTFCCIGVGALGFGIYRTSFATNSVETAPPPPREASFGRDADPRQLAQVRMPYRGDKCREYRFNNRTGSVTGESVAPCFLFDPESEQSGQGGSRNQALMKAFRFK